MFCGLIINDSQMDQSRACIFSGTDKPFRGQSGQLASALAIPTKAYVWAMESHTPTTLNAS